MELAEALGRWFGKVELSAAPQTHASVMAFLAELARMLEALEPTRVDHASSSVHQQQNGSVRVVVAHDSDEDGGLAIEAGDHSATIWWLSAHEHVDSRDSYGERPWTSVAVDVVAAALRGEYEAEEHFRGARWMKTRIIDVADPDGPRVVSSLGVLWSWLPLPGSKRVQRRRLDFGVQVD